MKFAFTRIAAGVAMVAATGGAQAMLTSIIPLTIENDAITTYGFNPANSTTEWYVSSNGPLADSFFTMGGSKTKQVLDTQYAYISGTPNLLDLNGSIEGTLGTFTYFGAPGSNDTGSVGGFSILSASGDTASIDMWNWKVDWNGVLDIPMGAGAWSVGYTNGVGNLTCTAGSGCMPGSTYTLKYTATVQVGDPSGFGGVKYYLELHGNVACMDCYAWEEEPTIPTIPEASTYGMMLVGLGLVGAMVRRRKRTEV
jgi:hypothetical protein